MNMFMDWEETKWTGAVGSCFRAMVCFGYISWI